MNTDLNPNRASDTALETVKPIAFLDVDGVLNRSMTRSVAKKRNQVIRTVDYFGFRVRVVLDPNDKELLDALAEYFELAWGTTWEENAAYYISPVIRRGQKWRIAKNTTNAQSKAPGIKELANGTPFVWFDDDAGRDDEIFLKDTNHKIIHVDDVLVSDENPDAETGLTWAHVNEAIEWAKNL